MPDRLLTATEVCEFLQISPRTLFNNRSAGKPTPPAIRVAGALRWSKDALLAWCDTQTEKTAA